MLLPASRVRLLNVSVGGYEIDSIVNLVCRSYETRVEFEYLAGNEPGVDKPSQCHASDAERYYHDGLHKPVLQCVS